MHLVTVTPPTTEPIELESVLDSILIGHHEDDALIRSFIPMARSRVEEMTGRKLISQTVDLVMRQFPDFQIEIPVAPVTSIVSISYVDADGAPQTIDAADYYPTLTNDKSAVEPVDSWPSADDRPGAVVVRLVVGYASVEKVHPMATQALQLLVAHRYENRDAVAAVKLYEIPYGVKDAINILRLDWL